MNHLLKHNNRNIHTDEYPVHLNFIGFTHIVKFLHAFRQMFLTFMILLFFVSTKLYKNFSKKKVFLKKNVNK